MVIDDVGGDNFGNYHFLTFLDKRVISFFRVEYRLTHNNERSLMPPGKKTSTRKRKLAFEKRQAPSKKGPIEFKMAGTPSGEQTIQPNFNEISSESFSPPSTQVDNAEPTIFVPAWFSPQPNSETERVENNLNLHEDDPAHPFGMRKIHVEFDVIGWELLTQRDNVLHVFHEVVPQINRDFDLWTQMSGRKWGDIFQKEYEFPDSDECFIKLEQILREKAGWKIQVQEIQGRTYSRNPADRNIFLVVLKLERRP